MAARQSSSDTTAPAPARPNDPFVERPACVVCASRRSRPVWRERFDAPVMRRWWDLNSYEVDVAEVLAGEWFELVECEDCTMRYQRWVFDPDHLRRLYSEWISPEQVRRCEEALAGDARAASTFGWGRRSVGHLLRLRRLASVADEDPVRLVDFGCGDGTFVRLARIFGFDASGVDASTTRHRQAADNGIRIVADLDELRAEGVDRVDVVTMFEVLEHLVDPGGALVEAIDLLEPDGVLLVEVPDCRDLDEPTTFEQFNLLNPLEHVNAFSPATLERLCRSKGLVPVRPGAAFVTARTLGVARSVGGALLRRRSTRRYFRRQAAGA